MQNVQFEEPAYSPTRRMPDKKSTKKQLPILIGIFVLSVVVLLLFFWGGTETDQNIKEGDRYVPAEY